MYSLKKLENRGRETDTGTSTMKDFAEIMGISIQEGALKVLNFEAIFVEKSF